MALFQPGNKIGVLFGSGNKLAVRHGHTWVDADGRVKRSPTYQSWRAMKERCYQESHPWYEHYGQRGIIVCDRWLGREGFANFLADMGKRPAKDMTLDRYPDVNGNYSKDNCRWATKSQQRVNVRHLKNDSDASTEPRARPKRKSRTSPKPLKTSACAPSPAS